MSNKALHTLLTEQVTLLRELGIAPLEQLDLIESMAETDLSGALNELDSLNEELLADVRAGKLNAIEEP